MLLLCKATALIFIVSFVVSIVLSLLTRGRPIQQHFIDIARTSLPVAVTFVLASVVVSSDATPHPHALVTLAVVAIASVMLMIRFRQNALARHSCR